MGQPTSPSDASALLAATEISDSRYYRDHFAKGVEVSKSQYLQQVLQEQQQIEARLQMLEQQPDERDVYLQSLPPLPEYILSVKARAASRPVVSCGVCLHCLVHETDGSPLLGPPWS